VARDRPAVVGEETPVSVEGDIEGSSYQSVRLWRLVAIFQSSAGYPKPAMSFQVVKNPATSVQARGKLADTPLRRCFCALHA
jgi:hypothetical protein